MSWTPPGFEPPGDLRAAAPMTSWRAAAEVIGGRHGFDASGATMAASGSDVVLDCGDVFVKLTHPRWVDEIFAEAEMSTRLFGSLPVAVPELVARGEVAGWPYVVTRRVEGRAIGAVWLTLKHAERLRLAEELGGVVAALHAVEVDASAASWPAFLEARFAGAIERERRAALASAWLDRIEPFLASVELSQRPPAWLHTEILDEHVLVTERDGRWRPSALLDFADGRAGHPGYELPAIAEFIFRGEPGLWAAFERGYGPLPGVEERMAWSLLHQFGRVTRCLEAVGEPEPASFNELARRLYS